LRPVIHWSEGRDGVLSPAHSKLIEEPMRLYGLEGQVDVVVEAKGHEQAVLQYKRMMTNSLLSHAVGRTDLWRHRGSDATHEEGLRGLSS